MKNPRSAEYCEEQWKNIFEEAQKASDDIVEAAVDIYVKAMMKAITKESPLKKLIEKEGPQQ